MTPLTERVKYTFGSLGNDDDFRLILWRTDDDIPVSSMPSFLLVHSRRLSRPLWGLPALFHSCNSILNVYPRCAGFNVSAWRRTYKFHLRNVGVLTFTNIAVKTCLPRMRSSCLFESFSSWSEPWGIQRAASLVSFSQLISHWGFNLYTKKVFVFLAILNDFNNRQGN